ncbi:hypothetical protein [Cerasicoccus fimbriatus]|uniref:hypothetical protein n=1 Tax=Cerasicoccus fimbriatus TaxID=3014554 RepID=UPI0022B2B740|nr:hypothetical protein [Cerasicoccus sp. TK19100]
MISLAGDSTEPSINYLRHFFNKLIHSSKWTDHFINKMSDYFDQTSHIFGQTSHICGKNTSSKSKGGRFDTGLASTANSGGHLSAWMKGASC